MFDEKIKMGSLRHFNDFYQKKNVYFYKIQKTHFIRFRERFLQSFNRRIDKTQRFYFKLKFIQKNTLKQDLKIIAPFE